MSIAEISELPLTEKLQIVEAIGEDLRTQAEQVAVEFDERARVTETYQERFRATFDAEELAVELIYPAAPFAARYGMDARLFTNALYSIDNAFFSILAPGPDAKTVIFHRREYPETAALTVQRQHVNGEHEMAGPVIFVLLPP